MSKLIDGREKIVSNSTKNRVKKQITEHIILEYLYKKLEKANAANNINITVIKKTKNKFCL